MTEEKFRMFHNRLSKVYRHLSKQARKAGITCYRVYDHDLPEFPLCIEFYDQSLYVAEYLRRHGMSEESHEQWIRKCVEIMSEILGIDPAHIFLKLRKRKSDRTDQYQKVGDTRANQVVTEGGLKFQVNLQDYLDTGLFLDHRITRGLVREQSAGRKVLNLFAYTGSFSVYAAAGGAIEVRTVDLSNTYLKWAEVNMSLNGFSDPHKYLFERADVLAYLKNARKDYHDIVVMDPPTFSNSKRMDDFLDVQRDHVSMINDCLAALKTGGLLYFSTNSRQFTLNKELIHASSIRDITRATTPFDFEGRFARWCYCITR